MRLIAILLLTTMLSACTSSQKQKEENAQLYLQIAVSQIESEDYPNALTSLLEAEKLDPKNALVQNNLGLVYFIRERYPQAEKHFENAVRLDGKYTDARNNLARVYIETGKYAAAEKELSVVLNDLTYSSFTKAYINLGLSKFNQKKYNEAIKSFRKAIETERDNCIANAYYGRTLFELKDYKRASLALDKSISFCQKQMYDEPHYYSALTYYRMGNKQQSIARFNEIIKLYPNGKYQDKARSMLELIRKENP